MRNDIILGRNNLKVESEEERQKSDRRLRKTRRGGANFLQLLYLPADFLYPIILNLKATTLKNVHKREVKQAQAMRTCSSASSPAFTVNILVTSALASEARASHGYKASEPHSGYTRGRRETPASEWRKENRLVDGQRTVNHADTVLLDAFALEHLEDPFGGCCKE